MVLMICAIALAWTFVAGKGEGWTRREITVIERSDSVMYVTTLIRDKELLRAPSADLGERELHSKRLKTLQEKMLRTVTDSSQDGVGIAAPQVGINRRVIWVQRFDKQGEPFECYLNVHLDSLWGEITHGPEGCLSVPPRRGYVPRYSSVKVSYVNPETLENVTETIEGYTAIIFQHECDHLDGVLYIDRADTVFFSEAWAVEREKYFYERPSWWTD